MWNKFRNVSIRNKLIFIIMGVTFSSLMTANIIQAFTAYYMMRAEVNSNLETKANFIGNNVASALGSLDRDAATQSLLSLAYEESIYKTCIYDDAGKLFASYIKKKPKEGPFHDPSIKHCPEGRREVSDPSSLKNIHIVKPIILNGNNLGYLFLDYEFAKDHGDFFRDELIAFIIMVFAMVFACFLAVRLQKPITSPIFHLSGIAAALADKQDFSIRAKKTNDDELGILVDAFNSILAGVEERDRVIMQVKEEAEKARDESRNANEMKSQFLATMSHEIRTPMNGIIGMTELLLETRMTQKQREFSLTVLSSADALFTIISDILDFSKIEAGELELELVAFDFLQVVEDAADLLSVKAFEKGVEMIVRYVPGTPRYLIGDPGRIRQVMINLMSNAVKFTEKGYVLIMIEEDQASTAEDGWHKIKVSVKDTGIGISKDKKKAVFEKFAQADSSTTRQFGGTGLGLAICRELSVLMDGEVGVESQLGVGSKFWFTMLLEEDANVNDVTILMHPDNLEGVRVLVVDDVPVNADLLEERLKAFGMRPEVCHDGVAALKEMHKATKAGEPYQMAVIDCLMPGMSGEELAREIKGNEKFKNPALVILTTVVEKSESQKFAEAGFSAFLTKPVRVAELVETLSLVWGEYLTGNTMSMIVNDYISSNKILTGIEAVQFKDTMILLVDDNRTNQAFAAEILEGANCHVDIAEDGKEAIEQVHVKPYDLIFMDCEMPEMNGFEATRMMVEMKKNKLLDDIPIVALTASAMKGDRERCIEAGMIDYISKPMRKIEMLEMLYKYLPEKVDESATEIVQVRFDGCKVLLVEDNRTNRIMTEEMLNEIGFDVSVAEHGKAALEAVKKNTYDLILMDVQMPVMDGFEATQKIRLMIEEEIIDNVPVIALTANAMKGDKERCLEVGMNDYLSKPVRKTDLNAVISKWITPCTAEEILSNDDEHPVLNEEFLKNYRDIMGEKFIMGVEGYLQDAQTFISHICQGWDKEDLKMIKISAHSLKSSSAMLGAMELSRMAEILEEDARDVLENGKIFKDMNPAISTEMNKALKRAVSCFERHLTAERQQGAVV